MFSAQGTETMNWRRFSGGSSSADGHWPCLPSNRYAVFFEDKSQLDAKCGSHGHPKAVGMAPSARKTYLPSHYDLVTLMLCRRSRPRGRAIPTSLVQRQLFPASRCVIVCATEGPPLSQLDVTESAEVVMRIATGRPGGACGRKSWGDGDRTHALSTRPARSDLRRHDSSLPSGHDFAR